MRRKYMLFSLWLFGLLLSSAVPQDQDECAPETDNCGTGYECYNIEGPFRCYPKRCPEGFRINSMTSQCERVLCAQGLRPDTSGLCVDINECEAKVNPCGNSQPCLNNVGSYRCLYKYMTGCALGFELLTDGETCVDIDECKAGTHDCRSQAECINRQGSYICSCPQGYRHSINELCEDQIWTQLANAGNFSQKKCTQKENTPINCKDVKREAIEKESAWPAGKYAIPMSSYGCPESYGQGWREGHLSLRWRSPHRVYVEHIYQYNSIFTDLTTVPFTKSGNMVFGQYRKDSFKIYFCYKYRHEPLLDVGIWPDGNYSIFGKNACPADFDSKLRNISLPEVSRWTKHGYTPDLEIFKGDPTILQMRFCSKTVDVFAMHDILSSENNDSFVQFGVMNWFENQYHFLLIQNHEEESCPVVANAEAIKDILFVENDWDLIPRNDSTNLMMFQKTCFYRTTEYTVKLEETEDVYEMRMKRIITAYSVHISNITKGYASGDIQGLTTSNYQDIIQTSRDVISWIILDLGRSVIISAIELGYNGDFYAQRHDILQMDIECNLADEKWSLFYSGSLKCLHLLFYDALNGTLELLFFRDMEGRFISLFDGNDMLKINEDSFYVDVFTKHVKYDSSRRCNMDLGMIGGDIKDEAISASSWLEEFEPGHSRPYDSGWCAEVSDEKPYIQIDLIKLTVIEGITIYNRESVLQFHKTSIQRTFVIFGVHIFSISFKAGNQTIHGGSEKFYVDTTKYVTHPQTFWFKTKARADSVQIFILQPLTEGFKCLRFELHGCKTAGENILVNRMTQSRHSENEVVSFVNEILEDSVRVSSLGYPIRHGGQIYMWIVILPKHHFINIRFLDILLGYYKDELSSCNDTITISSGLNLTDKSRVINYSFVIRVQHTLSVETRVTSLVMTHRTCTIISPSHEARGFTAVIKYEHVPTCFSLHETIPWHLGLKETCDQPAMILTSMSYLGFPFRKTTEEWSIHVPLHQIHLKIFQFNVVCQRDYSLSKFKIMDSDKESTYCNFDRPPDLINSSYDRLKISFYKSVIPYSVQVGLTEGFRMVYSSTMDKMEYLRSNGAMFSEVRNIALGKPAIMSSVDIDFRVGIDTRADKATDGILRQELRGGSCFLTSYEYEPWWMVDMQGVYRLEYIVIYKRLDYSKKSITKQFISDSPPDRPAVNVQITAGIKEMHYSGYICGNLRKTETIDQSGILARYVKLTVLHVWARFSLCEVQVYGQLEQEQAVQTDATFTFQRKVHGSWGDWTSWENICYCDNTRIRRRECNSPRPYYGGTPCVGRNVSYQYCRKESDCTIYNVALYKFTSSSSEDMYHSFEAVGGLYTSGCFETKREFQPWWMVDLQGVFHLDRVVIHLFQENLVGFDDLSQEKFVDRPPFPRPTESDPASKYPDNTVKKTPLENLEISTGITTCDMQARYFACYKDYDKVIVLPLLGVTGRFFKIQMVGQTNRLFLCEVEIYGQTAENKPNSNSSECYQHNQVDGGFSSWSSWSLCSNKCGNGLRSRRRSCNNPLPKYGGRDCFGEKKEIQACFGSCPVCSDTLGKCYSVLPSMSVWNNARYDCWKRHMQLVSIFSIEELRFIKTLLRERRFLDGDTAYSLFNVSFYAHIGLRFVNPDGKLFPVWENQVLAHFLAWKPGEPSARSCTRMNFQKFTEDNTWETVDCEVDLAEYFICEDRLKVTNKALSMLNVVYKRKQINFDVTYSGKVCQSWDRKYPHEHDFFQVLSVPEELKHNNYCSDIMRTGYLWCFTTDKSTRWEACNVRNDITLARECKIDIYNTGRQKVTISGNECLSWKKSYDDKFKSTDYDVFAMDNYCHDPFNDGYSWCYVETFYATRNVSRDICETGGGIEPKDNTYFLFPFSIWGAFLMWSILLIVCHIVILLVKSREDYFATYVFLYDILGKEDTKNPQMNYGDNETIDFYCDNGKTVPHHAKCNGRFECKDLTDENGCQRNFTGHQLLPPFNESENISSYNFIGMFFVCTTNEWINIIAVCDTVTDCFDSSDEKNCADLSDTTLLSGQKSCMKNQFQCNDGDCIHISQVCDFMSDCIDDSDEYCEHDLCSSSEYTCDNGECIADEQRCDAVRQCVDGSDENDCDTCQSHVAFHCDILRCIPKRLKCDNYVDCEDGSDEGFCGNEIYSSCREWWNAGYRKNGKYVTEDITVKCDFDDFQDYDIAYTVFDALDMYGRNHKIIGANSEMKDDVIYLSDRYDCVQQIKEVCEHSHLNMALTDQCDCAIYTLDPAVRNNDQTEKKNQTGYNESCSDVLVNNRSVTRYQMGPPRSFYTNPISEIRPFRMILCKDCWVQIGPIGPAICTDSKSDNNILHKDEFPCAQNGQIFPVTQKCIYDVDTSGFPSGCRDGSHLANCEQFNCPKDTVKCPGSFCLPVRYVCDGEINCEGGHDEENCGCESSENEILILYEKGTAEELFIRQFSRQFYTKTNIVRVLSFNASKPLKSFDMDSTQINVTDRQIDQSGDTTRLPTCSYKVMSRDFVKSVKFSNNGTRGLIYIQNSLSSKEVADEMFSNIHGLIGDYKFYLVTQDFNTDYNNQSFVPKVIPVRVRRWKILTATGAEYFSALCKVNSKVHCQGQYKCASSKMCIPLDQVCDGYRHCLHGDDELVCDFECPYGCFCNGLAANCRARNMSHVYDIPKTTRELDLSLNKRLDSVLQMPVLDLIVLSILNLSGCDIDVITRNAFNRLRNLQLLDISYNLIRSLPNRVFSSLKQLKTLHIHGNYYMSKIDPKAFQNLFLIRDLNLANSLLRKISANTFAGLKLKSLDLSNNKLENIEPFAFNELSANIINFEGNTIKSLNKDIFTGVIDLQLLRTPSFKFCCIRPNYVDEHNCIPTRDEFSSCEDLMRHSVLQFLLWLVGMLALLGNCLSLIYRLKVDRKRLQLGFGIFVTNLAAADLLMGVYLLIIAIADAVFRKRYIYEDEKWRGSFLCNLAGVLSTISSECSVFLLCLITLDRLLVIKFPFRPKYFTKKKSIICVLLAWVTSSFIAVLPVVYESYFQNKFYSRSGVCIALPLTRDRPPGWVYSILVFVLFNFITFLLVAVGQWTIFYEMRKSRGMATTAKSSRVKDLKVARNLLLVVATDFMCWFPIGVMGVTALSGHVISGDVYAWAAVFILPVNSALNPILYTLTAIIGGKAFQPSTNEHLRVKEIKEIGEGALELHAFSRRLAHKEDFSSSKYWSVNKILVEEIDIPPVVLLRSTAQLAGLLKVLHDNCLGIQSLDNKSVLISVRNGKVLGDVKIREEPYVCVPPKDKSDDIYRFGVWLRNISLLSKRHL